MTIDNLLKNIKGIKQVKIECPAAHKAFNDYLSKKNFNNYTNARLALEVIKYKYTKEIWKIYEHVYESMEDKQKNIIDGDNDDNL